MSINIDVEVQSVFTSDLFRCRCCKEKVQKAVFIDLDEKDDASVWFRLCVQCYNDLVRKLITVRLEGKV